MHANPDFEVELAQNIGFKNMVTTYLGFNVTWLAWILYFYLQTPY